MSIILSEELITDRLTTGPDYVFLNGRRCFWTGKTAIGLRHEVRMPAPLSRSEEWLQTLLVIPTKPTLLQRFMRWLHK